MASHTRRLLLFDDNIRGPGGHYLELATLLAQGAVQQGYKPTLVTNRDYTETTLPEVGCPVVPVFRQRRLVRWSLGVDGASETLRDPSGRPESRSSFAQIKQRFRDRLARPDRHPKRMLREYAEDIVTVWRQLKVSSEDVLLFNTSDDFSLLGLAQAIELAGEIDPLNIHALFHFAIHDHKSANGLPIFGTQVNQTVDRLRPHRIHLHATTDPLMRQMRLSGVESPVRSIPYPTRTREVSHADSASGRIKIVLAGLPRAEKGRSAMVDLLDKFSDPLLRETKFCMSMQMPVKRWKRMVPSQLHSPYEAALERPLNLNRQSGNTEPLEILTSNLDTATYHRWLDTADIGLFLYEPNRYVARCSGVLLEMLNRGIPVLVPDQCWLAEFVRQMSGDQPCGLIYTDRSQVPDRIRQMARDHARFRNSAIAVAKLVAKQHSGQSSIQAMEIECSDQLRPQQPRPQQPRTAAA